MLRIPFIYVDMSGARAVCCAVGVIGGDCVLRARSYHGNHGKFVLWETTEEFGELWFHFVHVLCVKVEQLLAGSGVEAALAFDVFIERSEILESEFVCEG